MIPNGFHYFEINCFFFLKKFSEFSNFKVSVLFCLIVSKLFYELVNNRFFLVNYRLFCLFSVLSDAILALLLRFVFYNGHKFFDVINVCCCCLFLPFVFARFLNIGISHQSNASFFTPLIYLLWRLSFRSYTSFFKKKYLNFLCFSICSSFGRQLCQNCGWAGSELYVQSHFTEPPCIIESQIFLLFHTFQTGDFSFKGNGGGVK